jgi:hypothetical protein
MTTNKERYQLAGKRCPECQSTGPFLLDPSENFTVADDGHLEFTRKNGASTSNVTAPPADSPARSKISASGSS